MTSSTIALHEPEMDVLDEEFVLEALRSNWVSTGGPFVDRFEWEFADYVGAKYAVSTSSGTTALHLMLEVLAEKQGIKAPFEVLVPTLTFIASANGVVHAGGVPVFVDCAPDSLNISPELVQKLIPANYLFDHAKKLWFSKTSRLPLLAVLPTHIMGATCDMSILFKVCEEFEVPILEDAAEALGSFYKNGKHVGLTGIAGAFSFNGNKILTTGGGGMIVSNDADFAKKAKHLSTTAKTDNLRFVHDRVGYNYRMVNVLAALGCSQLKKLKGRLLRKVEIREEYKEVLRNSDIRIHEEHHCESNNWLISAVFKDNASREKALVHLVERNIQVRPLWTPLHCQPAFAENVGSRMSYPNADAMWKRCLSLPSSPQLKTETIKSIARELLNSQLGA